MPLVGFSADDWIKIVALTAGAQLLGHTLINLVLRSTSATVVSLAMLFEVPGATSSPRSGSVRCRRWRSCRRVLLLGVGLVLVIRSGDARRSPPRRPPCDTAAADVRTVGAMSTPNRALRSRRSNLAVPGSNPKMLEKAKGLPADQVFLDLEDAVAPLAKAEARKNIVAALNEGGYGDKVRTVRVNDWTTQWTYRDVIEVVENAGSNLDCIMLPKVQTRRAGRRARRCC